MYVPPCLQLDVDLDRVMHRLRHLQQLDLSVEANLQQALDESLQLLGAIALYRHSLREIEACKEMRQRRAA